MALRFDGSEMMAMTEAMDSLPEAAMDSVIYFSDILDEKKDSISRLSAEEQQRLEKLRPYRMHIQSDPEKASLLFTLARDFDQISEMGNAFAAFQDASALDSDAGPGGQNPSEDFHPATEVAFSFDNGRFTRRTTITDSTLHQQQVDSLEGAGMFLSGSTYTLKIQFPGKVRSATAADATLSMDGKTLIREVDFLEYLKDPTLLDMEVELEQ